MKKSSLITAALLLAALTAFAPALQAQGTLKSITTQKDGAQLVVTIAVDGAFTHEAAFLTSPKRLVVDLNSVSTIAASPYTQVGEAGILDIRTGQFKPETARVVFDMGQATPAYSVSAVAGGLKLVFWLEAADEQPAQPVREPVREPARETERQATERTTAPTYDGRTGFFVRAGVGLAFFLTPEFVNESSYTLYGETATSSETYTWKSGLAIEGSIGKYFLLGSIPIKAGLEFTYWQFKPQVNVALSLPHPFLSGSNRGVEFIESEGLETSFQRYSAYAQFSFLESGPISVWLGPLVGVTKGKLVTLDEYDIDEKAPYAATDIAVTNRVYYEHVFSQLHLGAVLGVECRLTDKMSLSIDTKFLLFNPQTIKFTESFNMMHLQPSLSVQYSF
jgi:hypothetical protein